MITIQMIRKERDLIRTAALIYCRALQINAALNREKSQYFDTSKALRRALQMRQSLMDLAPIVGDYSWDNNRCWDRFWTCVLDIDCEQSKSIVNPFLRASIKEK